MGLGREDRHGVEMKRPIVADDEGLPANPCHVRCPPVRRGRTLARCRDSARRGPWLLKLELSPDTILDGGLRTARFRRRTDLPLVRRVLREDQTPRGVSYAQPLLGLERRRWRATELAPSTWAGV